MKKMYDYINYIEPIKTKEVLEQEFIKDFISFRKENNLTQSQISQVFVSGHVRSLGAQRAWMESQREYKLPQPMLSKAKYKIEGNLLVISVPTAISCSDLKKIISQMENTK